MVISNNNTSFTINRYLIFILQKGLVCCIEIYNHHTHTIKSAESLRFIPAGDDLKNMFYEYFDSGMGITESQKYHEQLLELKEDFTYTCNLNFNLRTYILLLL